MAQVLSSLINSVFGPSKVLTTLKDLWPSFCIFVSFENTVVHGRPLLCMGLGAPLEVPEANEKLNLKTLGVLGIGLGSTVALFLSVSVCVVCFMSLPREGNINKISGTISGLSRVCVLVLGGFFKTAP